MPFPKRLPRRQVLLIAAIAVPLVLVVLVLWLAPFQGTAFEAARGYLLAGLFLPAAGLAAAEIRMGIDDKVNRRVEELLHGGETAPAGRPRDPAAAAALAEDEIRTVAGSLRAALGTLRKRRFGSGRRHWLYQLPWYAVIGPSGSGKTTAIQNSGLHFPLGARHGSGPLQGIGGTRHCDWWFTDEAVLIDTAGRYTTQQDPSGPERAAWLGFLRLLRRHRRREPVNGVLVVIGLDLIAGPEAARRDQAQRIRQRVRELYDGLGLTLPVYVVISKLDLVDGFGEFFDDLGRDSRDAVLGITFDLPADGAPAPCEALAPEFDALVDSLDARLVKRLQQELDGARRGAIFGFPQRIAALRGPVADFVGDVFQPSSFETPFLLRGVYLASGTQSPHRFDAFLRRIDPAPGKPGGETARSYFLARLLREVVFGEAGLVAADPQKARRRARLRQGARAAIALAAGGAACALVALHLRGSAEISAFGRGLDSFAAQAAALRPDTVAEPDFAAALVPLATIRQTALRARDAQGPGPLPGSGRVLASQGAAAYGDALRGILLPRLVLAAERDMAEAAGDPDALFAALKAYLLLGGRGDWDAAAVRHWAERSARAALPGPENGAKRLALLDHADALLALGQPDFPLDPGAIAAARAGLAGASPAGRLLAAITAGEAAAALPAWRLTDVAGPEAEKVFRDRRGPLDGTVVPGLYTARGFREAVLPALEPLARAQAREIWVLEDRPPAEGEALSGLAARLAAEATDLYLRELALRWDETLSALAVVPLDSLPQALRVMNSLSAPSSPIRLLLASVAEETAIERPAPPAAEDGTAAEHAPPAPGPAAAAALAAAEEFAPAHFREIRALIEVPDNSQSGALPSVDQVIADLRDLYRQLRDIQASGTVSSLGHTAGAAMVMRQVRASAAALPEPVQSWIADISTGTVSRSASSARAALNARWQAGPAELCRAVAARRYPFAANAAEEAPLAEFGALFGPGGAIDRFVEESLAASIDRSGSPWRWRDQGGLGANAEGGLDPEALAALERAAAIRDALFRGTGQRPSVDFQVSLRAAEPAGATVRLAVNGEEARFKRGGTRAARMHWPGAAGLGRAAIGFPRLFGGREPGIAASGDWALYRLLDRAARRSAGAAPGALEAVFAADGRSAGLVFQSDAAVNPLDRSLMAGFRCPEGF
ncbi:type VI secretion system membrane subunit TssM [Poseidonocella sp. HB161398]|uniref:type VI secretion system membrane subunit TssM n=1 Tax=Poseidonocella sp. HB161398 TaxID=2320855 RepID=UPI0011096410|nr:type VI secretion system membrane subunit TssM [Poseidonocella sp. HB161398]